MDAPRLLVALTIAGALSAVAGCGSESPFPPAAEPDDAPVVEREPAGRTVEVGNGPEGIVAAESAGRIAVGLRNPDQLALLNARTGRVERRVDLPESPRHLALGPDGEVLVPAERANRFLTVDPADGTTRELEVGEFPHDAAVVGGRTVVADERSSTLSVIDGDRVAQTLPTAEQPGGTVAVGDRLAVVAVAQRVVTLYDARRELTQTARIEAGVGPTHAATDGTRLFVVDTQGDALLRFALTPKLRLAGRTTLPGSPYGIAVDAKRNRAWVTLTGRNELVELDISQTAKAVRTLPTVRQPNTVAVDTRDGRVFVAGRAEGQVQIIDP
ncbi:MAG: YncE family protein [Solirubrobacterales bacterium]